MTERLTIERLKDGGFAISNPDLRQCIGEYFRPHFQFGATTIDKALDYVKEQLQPGKAKA